jgi:hypothetical protein
MMPEQRLSLSVSSKESTIYPKSRLSMVHTLDETDFRERRQGKESFTNRYEKFFVER